jgi:hypothetical protein
VVDVIDGTNAPPGSMTALANLMQDPTTPGVYVPRAASVQLPGSVAGTGAITVFLILGDILYGLATNGAYDEPFAYNLATQELYYPISGVAPATNCPIAQPTSGDWVPPTIDSVGIYVLITHPGFTGPSNGYIGWFDITSPTAPVWNSGTTKVNALAGVPTAVRVFGGRAYYAVANAVEASDPFQPLTRTNANQVLTLGDASAIAAMKGLPLNNTQGGIIQSLICFKENSQIFQITGDYTGVPSPWAVNTLNVAVQTFAPNSIVPTPAGLAFVAADGLRFIDFNSNVSDPVGQAGKGVRVPFMNSPAPSRMCAAFNMNVLCIAVRQSALNAADTVEFWYDMSQQSWIGPQSLPTLFIASYRNYFIRSMLPAGG